MRTYILLLLAIGISGCGSTVHTSGKIEAGGFEGGGRAIIQNGQLVSCSAPPEKCEEIRRDLRKGRL